MHNHHEENFSGMLWMMAICCLGPLIVVFFAGRARGGLPTWLILGALATCIIAHLFMHRKHRRPAAQATEAKNKPEDKDPRLNQLK